MIKNWCLHMLVFALLLLNLSRAQFPRDSDQYKEKMYNEEMNLAEDLLESNSEINYWFRPESALLKRDNYRFDFPLSTVYRINVIIDPCRGLRADCCMNVFGVPEYPSLLRNNLEPERVVKYPVIGNESEVAINYELIYEDGSPVLELNSRYADDETIFDTRCRSLGVPFSFCQDKNYAYQRSPYRPACLDYNQTLNADAGCTKPDNTTHDFCVAVAYTQNAFIPQCGVVDDNCGTFLEIHQIQGTPYTSENFLIASARIETRNVSGYYTTTLPLTWNNSDNKILCAYTESYIRVGSIVYIKPSAPVCCCAQPYKPQSRIGSWQCPVGPNGYGATATVPKNLAEILLTEEKNNAYPFCPNDVGSKEDLMMCSVYAEADQRHYLTDCDPVTRQDTSGALNLGYYKYGSSRLFGWVYDGECEYYSGCALTLDDGKCKGNDLVFKFTGMVGLVTAVDDKSLIPTVMVSFNDGRTSYKFLKTDVTLELSKSMYEIWWVVRTPVENVVEKRKGFNITAPTCTLDLINNRYFPYTILDRDPVTGVLYKNRDGSHVYKDSGTSFE